MVHALTNAVPLAGHGDLKCRQVATQWGDVGPVELTGDLTTPPPGSLIPADAGWALVVEAPAVFPRLDRIAHRGSLPQTPGGLAHWRRHLARALGFRLQTCTRNCIGLEWTPAPVSMWSVEFSRPALRPMWILTRSNRCSPRGSANSWNLSRGTMHPNERGHGRGSPRVDQSAARLAS